MASAAYQRFLDSMRMDYEKWHDGVGYDLDALAELTPQERRSVAMLLRGRDGWRDAVALEALARLGEQSADETVWRLIEDDAAPIEQRLIAMEKLRDSGRLDDATLERLLLPALNAVQPYGGLTPALRLVQQIPTEPVKRRLLWGTIHNPEAGVHFAAMLAFLCGAAESEFDWSLRPLFLRTAHGEPSARTAAIDELCALIGMKPEDAA